MRRAALALAALAACVACNEILGIEDHPIVSSAGPCDGGACAIRCSSAAPCPSGAVCVQGRCAELDGGDACAVGDERPECMCGDGYRYVDGACVRVSACEQDNGGCPDNADCEESATGPTCDCKPGFVDPTGDGTQCVDPCESADCPPEFSTCSVVGAVAVCACLPSYLFVEAENACIFDEDCAALGCDDDAQCVIDGAERGCECNPGFEGDGFDCENPDECDPNPCINGGVCNDALGGFECACASGFAGEACESNIDDCASEPCMNGGTCMDLVASYECTCAAGWSGPSCDSDEDACAEDPCTNGGECIDDVGGFHCDCALGFMGELCETNITDCTPGLCENGGECVDEVSAYRCECLPGFSGPHCATNDDDCDPNPCMNGGDCSDGEDAFSCACDPGWGGDTCATNLNECSPDPCVHGDCHDLLNGFDCSCEPGWNGDLCDNDIDDCAGEPCVHGDCTDELNGYDCDCDAGWEGTDCDVNVDECSPNPCLNGGDCTDGTDDYTCVCTGGFSGENCQTPPACTPNVDFCEEGTRYARDCTPGGTLGTRTDCWAQSPPNGRTCVNGACSGECAEGRLSCEGQTPVLCDSTGNYDQNGDSCDTPDFVCRSGACESNPIDYIGLHASTGSTRTQSASSLYATRVRTTAQVSLVEIGIYGSATGGGVRLAVYSDQVIDGDHYPNALVASGTDTLTVAQNIDRVTDPAGSVSLMANTDYWIVAVTSSTASGVYSRAAAAGTNVMFWSYPSGFTFASPFPATFPIDAPNFGAELSTDYSLFLRVQAIP